MKKLLIVDGYSVISQIYYNVPFTVNGKGRHTNALQGFVSLLKQELDMVDGVYLVWGNKKRLKHTLNKNACLQHNQYPDGLMEQLEDIEKLMKEAEVTTIHLEEVSGRAIIFTVLQQADKSQISCRILTADESVLAFISDTVEVVLPQIQDKKVVWTTFDKAFMEEKYQVAPSAWNLVEALSGGVSTGLGKGYASELALRYTDLDAIYEHIDEIESQYVKQILLQKKQDFEERYQVLCVKNPTDITIDFDSASKFDLSETVINRIFTDAGIAVDAVTFADDKEIKTNQRKVTWSYKLEKVKNTSQADTIWKACMESGVTGLQLFKINGQKETQLLASSNGQMFLQFGEETPSDTTGVALVNTNYPDTVFWMSSDEALSEEYLKDKLSEFISTGKSTFATFDVKGEYGWMLGNEKAITLKETERIFDIKIAAYLLNPLSSDYQIGDIAAEYLNLKMDTWKDLFGKADLKSAYLEKKDQLIDYYARMAWVSYLACSILEEKLLAEGMKQLYREIEMPLTYVLYDMEKEGIRIQPEALKQYGDSLQVRIAELEQTIYQEVSENFNINSPKQLGEVLFEKLGLPGGKKTKTGYSTAADVLERLSEEYPIVNLILEYRQLTKLKSTYADGLANYIEDDGRIHTNFNQTITATGRLSSTEPNLQNIPMRMELGRLIRKVFVPKEDCVFMDADYSQIELRVLAHMSEDKTLIEAYQMSEDIHRITASQVFHTPFEEVTDLQRRNAKAVNFGIVYGISSFGLSQGLSITRQEATEYIEKYFETYPGVKNFLDRLVSEAKLSGKSKSMFGRIRPIPELQSSNYMQRQFGERVAMNAPIQGTAADIIKIAMIKVFAGLQEAGLKSKLILQIHDELLIETYENEQEQVKEIMETQMQAAADLSVALDIDLHTGSDWYEAK